MLTPDAVAEVLVEVLVAVVVVPIAELVDEVGGSALSADLRLKLSAGALTVWLRGDAGRNADIAGQSKSEFALFDDSLSISSARSTIMPSNSSNSVTVTTGLELYLRRNEPKT